MITFRNRKTPSVAQAYRRCDHCGIYYLAGVAGDPTIAWTSTCNACWIAGAEPRNEYFGPCQRTEHSRCGQAARHRRMNGIYR